MVAAQPLTLPAGAGPEVQWTSWWGAELPGGSARQGWRRQGTVYRLDGEQTDLSPPGGRGEVASANGSSASTPRPGVTREEVPANKLTGPLLRNWFHPGDRRAPIPWTTRLPRHEEASPMK